MKSRDPRDLQQQIDEEAARWMLRKEAGPLSTAQMRRYEAWSKLPHRAETLQRMEAFADGLKQPWKRRRLQMRFAVRDESAEIGDLLLPPSPDPLGT